MLGAREGTGQTEATAAMFRSIVQADEVYLDIATVGPRGYCDAKVPLPEVNHHTVRPYKFHNNTQVSKLFHQLAKDVPTTLSGIDQPRFAASSPVRTNFLWFYDEVEARGEIDAGECSKEHFVVYRGR